MGNVAVKYAPPGTEIGAFLQDFSVIGDAAELKRTGHEFLGRFPVRNRLEVASLLSWANPFFLAEIPEETAEKLSLSLAQFNELLMRAKLTTRRSSQLNILLACAPKSASTFIESALRSALGLPSASLFTTTVGGFSASMLGANLREQQPEELALLRNGLNGTGYVAQHHARCTPYLARLLSAYKVRPIVTHRNLFDTIVSMDDMIMAYRGGETEGADGYFDDAMPADYGRLDLEDRLTILVQQSAAWLIQFYVGWKKCERLGLVAPLWISYEKDFLGDKQVLADRVSRYLGSSHADPQKLADAFADRRGAEKRRFNKGVAGRGRDMPASVRDMILKAASYYRDEEDISALVGEG